MPLRQVLADPDPTEITKVTMLHYTAMPLKRHGDLRQDPIWLDRQLATDQTLVLPMWADKNLFRVRTRTVTPAMLPRTDAIGFLDNASEIIYLGHDDECALFVIDLTRLDRNQVQTLIDHTTPDCQFIDLRRVSTAVTSEQASLLAYARGLTVWHRNHSFCARCGHRTHARRGGHMRQCGQCGREHFPRIDPAVIMLVVQPGTPRQPSRCLLGRHHRLPGRVYSTLAGYVDPGETLEQAVAREVWEEARVRVSDIRYVASQPWPFPGSLMLGFRASSGDGEPDTSGDELDDARWFTATQVRQFGEYGADSGAEFELPRRDSIARMLIAQWLAEHP